MTSSNGSIFRVTGHLCKEFTGLRLNKRLSKNSWGWWLETLSHPLWRHRNDICTPRCFGIQQPTNKKITGGISVSHSTPGHRISWKPQYIYLVLSYRSEIWRHLSIFSRSDFGDIPHVLARICFRNGYDTMRVSSVYHGSFCAFSQATWWRHQIKKISRSWPLVRGNHR